MSEATATRPPYIGVHLLWPAIAANVNSGESGAQKTTVYGGVQRAVWASQSQKRPTRRWFERQLPLEDRAVRTRRHAAIATRLAGTHGWDQDVATELCAMLWSAATGGDSGKGLVLTGADIIERAVERITDTPGARGLVAAIGAKLPAKGSSGYAEAKRVKEEAQKVLNSIANDLFTDSHNTSIAMHGRMMADRPDFNVHAAVQVASGISVDAWRDTNVDYWSAVDDLDPDAGSAGNLGNRDRGTNLFYRYASINVPLFARQAGLGGDEAEALAARWIEAFIAAKPSRSASSTAPYADPVFMAVHRPENPLSLHPFFAAPIDGHDQHRRAAQQLLDYYSQTQRVHGRDDRLAYCSTLDGLSPSEHTVPVDTVTGLLDHATGTRA